MPAFRPRFGLSRRVFSAISTKFRVVRVLRIKIQTDIQSAFSSGPAKLPANKASTRNGSRTCQHNSGRREAPYGRHAQDPLLFNDDRHVQCHCSDFCPCKRKNSRIGSANRRQNIDRQERVGKDFRSGWLQAGLAQLDNDVCRDPAKHPGLQAVVRAMKRYFDAIDLLGVAGMVTVGYALLMFGTLP
jgi:hypothetical protein